MSGNNSESARVALVTGAARGIGQTLAVGLAARGDTVIAVDLREAAETVAAVEKAGGKIHAYEADITSEQAVADLAKAVTEEVGGVDILVNNAGVVNILPFTELSFEEFRRILSVNLDAQFLTAKAFAPGMIEREWGRIVNVSSSAVFLTAPNLTAYVTSKMGVIGLTTALSSDLGQYGITVNAVSPSNTLTPMVQEMLDSGKMDAGHAEAVVQGQAIKKAGTPEDVLGAVKFLSSEEAYFVTGQFIAADGGLSHH